MLSFFSSVRVSGSYCIIVSSDPPATTPRPNGRLMLDYFALILAYVIEAR